MTYFKLYTKLFKDIHSSLPNEYKLKFINLCALINIELDNDGVKQENVIHAIYLISLLIILDEKRKIELKLIREQLETYLKQIDLKNYNVLFKKLINKKFEKLVFVQQNIKPAEIESKPKQKTEDFDDLF